MTNQTETLTHDGLNMLRRIYFRLSMQLAFSPDSAYAGTTNQALNKIGKIFNWELA